MPADPPNCESTQRGSVSPDCSDLANAPLRTISPWASRLSNTPRQAGKCAGGVVGRLDPTTRQSLRSTKIPLSRVRGMGVTQQRKHWPRSILTACAGGPRRIAFASTELAGGISGPAAPICRRLSTSNITPQPPQTALYQARITESTRRSRPRWRHMRTRRSLSAGPRRYNSQNSSVTCTNRCPHRHREIPQRRIVPSFQPQPTPSRMTRTRRRPCRRRPTAPPATSPGKSRQSSRITFHSGPKNVALTCKNWRRPLLYTDRNQRRGCWTAYCTRRRSGPAYWTAVA